MKKVWLVILSILILSLCSCAKKQEPIAEESTAPSQEQTSAAATKEEEKATEETAAPTVITEEPGTKYEIRMENGDMVKITVREGWEISKADEKTLLAGSGDYIAIYSDSRIKVGDTEALEALMEERYEVPKENTGTLNINDKECFAGYKTLEDGTNLIHFFQDVGVKNYVLIDITDKTGDRVEIAMSEFAIY